LEQLPNLLPLEKKKKIPAHILLSVNEWKPNTQISLAGPRKNQLNTSIIPSKTHLKQNKGTHLKQNF